MKTRTSAAYDMQDIRRAAYSMIANHGTYAMHVAMKRARNLVDDDSRAARQTWEHIVRAIGEIQKAPLPN